MDEQTKFSFNLSLVFFILAIISNGLGLCIDIVRYENTVIGNINLISVVFSFSLVTLLGIIFIFFLKNYNTYPVLISLLMAFVTFPMLLLSSKDGGFLYFVPLISSTFGLVLYLHRAISKLGFLPILLYDFLFFLKIKYNINIEHPEYFICNFAHIIIGMTVSYFFTFFVTSISFGQLYKLGKKLKEQAYKDPLTSAYNRYYLYNQKLENAAIILLDIDHFKRLNDEFGHDNGDQSLKLLVEVINKNIRKNDYIVRYGGEEFIIILKNIFSWADLYDKAENIRLKVLGTSRISKQIKKAFTVSIGAVIYDNRLSLEQNIKFADLLLYQSKRLGRNRTSIKN